MPPAPAVEQNAPGVTTRPLPPAAVVVCGGAGGGAWVVAGGGAGAWVVAGAAADAGAMDALVLATTDWLDAADVGSLAGVVDPPAEAPNGFTATDAELPTGEVEDAGCQLCSSGVDSGYMGAARRAQRVVIADDDVLLREGLAALLREAGYDVVRQASDAEALLKVVETEQPDIAIVDIRMPPTHTTEGLEAAQSIRERRPEVAILVLSAHIELEHAMDLLGGGRGIGYVLKSRLGDVDELTSTLERISSGGSVVDPMLVEELVRARRVRDPLEALTARERDVLTLMAEGRSNTGIARALWIAEGTVDKHVRRIFEKLQLPDAPDDHRRVLAVIAFLDSS